MERASQVGYWINTPPCAQIHTVMDKQEFVDNLLLRYHMQLKDMPEKCNGCANKNPFKLQHALCFKVRGLATGHHNDIHDYLSIMGMQAFTSYYVYN